jgi:16S rRNA (adenine1518-N6/adenine1519-N6)-dimethyltransferase
VRSRKRFGQHFLEPAWVAKIVDRIAPHPGETIVEIGPGKGALTLPLAERGARVTAIEIDRDLAAQLTKEAPPNVTVVVGDFLKLPVTELAIGGPPVRLVGNLPYYISSPLIFRVLDIVRTQQVFSDAYLMLQAEVADRVVSGPGSGDYGPLSIFVTLEADTERLLELPPGAFRPMPKVSSTLVRLRFRPSPVLISDFALFSRIVRAMFTQRRKTLGNALKAIATADGLMAVTVLEQAGLDPRRRPETLQLSELAALTGAFSSKSDKGML